MKEHDRKIVASCKILNHLQVYFKFGCEMHINIISRISNLGFSPFFKCDSAPVAPEGLLKQMRKFWQEGALCDALLVSADGTESLGR